MIDISQEENKAIHTQLIMNKINLNQDVLNIIKSFTFYDKKIYIQKRKQTQLKDKLIKLIKNLEYYSKEYSEEDGNGNTFNHVAIWIPSLENKNEDEIQFQASICGRCGKYTEVGTFELENIIVHNHNIFCANWRH